jgi:hypothetical protein
MLVWMVHWAREMLAQLVLRTPQMFARQVAIFRREYLEIGHLIGE